MPNDPDVMRRYRDLWLFPRRRSNGGGDANHGRAANKNVYINANGIEEVDNDDG